MAAYYLSVVRRRLWFVCAAAAIFAPAMFFALTAGPATYTSEAVIQVGSGDVTEGLITGSRAYEEPERRVATDLEVLTGRAVAEGAADRLRALGWTEGTNELMTRVEAAPRGGASAIEVVGTDTSPLRAQQLTAAFVDSYIDYQRDAQREESERVQADLQRRLADAAAAGDSQSRYDTLAEWLEGVTLRLSVDTSGLQLISPPSLPEEPTTAVSPVVAGVSSIFAALLLGCALALAVDLVSDSVRGREDAELLLPEATLVEVPKIRENRGAWVGALSDPTDPTSYAARGIRIRLDSTAAGTGPRHILVVGTKGDGRDMLLVAAALAAAYGRSRANVLLIADDVDGTGIDQRARTTADSTVITTDGAPDAVATAVDQVWSARATTSREGVPGFLDARDPAEALDRYNRSFDHVVVAMPPAAHEAEAVAISRLVEAVVVVCALGRTPAKGLRQLVTALERSGTIVGVLALTTKVRKGKRRWGRSAPHAASPVAAPLTPLAASSQPGATSAEAPLRGDVGSAHEREERSDEVAADSRAAAAAMWGTESRDTGWPAASHPVGDLAVTRSRASGGSLAAQEPKGGAGADAELPESPELLELPALTIVDAPPPALARPADLPPSIATEAVVAGRVGGQPDRDLDESLGVAQTGSLPEPSRRPG